MIDVVKEMKDLRDIQAKRVAIGEQSKATSPSQMKRERKLLAKLEADAAKFERMTNGQPRR